MPDPLASAADGASSLLSSLPQGVEYWCFHDRDIAPKGETLKETNANLDAIVALAKELQGVK